MDQLIDAIIKNNTSKVDLLISLNKNLDAKDNNNMTALMWAVLLGHLGAVKIILNKPQNINAVDNYHTSSLILASANGHLEIVKLLLIKGAQVNVGYNKSSALIKAASKSHNEIVEILLNYGANLNHKDFYGNNALICAAKKNNIKLLDLLLSRGGDIDSCDLNGFTPLMHSVSRNSVESIEYLLVNGANINNTNASGNNALDIAIQYNSNLVIKSIITKALYLNYNMLQKLFDYLANTQNNDLLILLAEKYDLTLHCQEFEIKFNQKLNHEFLDIVQVSKLSNELLINNKMNSFDFNSIINKLSICKAEFSLIIVKHISNQICAKYLEGNNSFKYSLQKFLSIEKKFLNFKNYSNVISEFLHQDLLANFEKEKNFFYNNNKDLVNLTKLLRSEVLLNNEKKHLQAAFYTHNYNSLLNKIPTINFEKNLIDIILDNIISIKNINEFFVRGINKILHGFKSLDLTEQIEIFNQLQNVVKENSTNWNNIFLKKCYAEFKKDIFHSTLKQAIENYNDTDLSKIGDVFDASEINCDLVDFAKLEDDSDLNLIGDVFSNMGSN